MSEDQYVTRAELAELVKVLDHRFERIERWLQVLSTGLFIELLIEIYIVHRIGL